MFLELNKREKGDRRGRLDTGDACSHGLLGLYCIGFWEALIKLVRMYNGRSVNKSTGLLHRMITFKGLQDPQPHLTVIVS